LASLAAAFLRLLGRGVIYPNWFGVLAALVVAAVVVLVSCCFVNGMKANGFTGAQIAALAYGVIGFLFQWVIDPFGSSRYCRRLRPRRSQPYGRLGLFPCDYSA
jgi:ABC-type uncharacterized transport system permease subunit